MYSKFVAILINSAFGLCITYTVFSVYFALTSKFIVERSFILGFSLYNIVWLVLDIVYNEAIIDKAAVFSFGHPSCYLRY